MSTEAILRHRRDTAANWTSINPILEDGQLGWETDTRKGKLGDGVTAWNSLGYIAGGAPIDHGALTGLGDDDHTQYHNDARGDARYSLLGHNHSGTYQPLDATLTAVAGLDATAGLVEQTGADTFTKRAIGVATATDIPTRGDADTRYAAYSHSHATGDYKESVQVATTANITLSGEQTIDGVLTSASRVLVKNQTTGSENGIYVTDAGAWSRAADADVSAEVTSGILVVVDEGSTQSNNIYQLTTSDPITLGTTALTFSLIQAGVGFFINKSISAASYTLKLVDSGRRVNMTNGSSNTVTVPTNASVAFPVNTEIEVCQLGAGVTTIVASGGVTINSPAGLMLPARYAVVKLKKRGTNVWELQIDGAPHTHAQSDITNLVSDLAGKQPLDAGLTSLAGLGATAGLIEKTATDTYTERAIGVGASTSIPTRADGDSRWAQLTGATFTGQITFDYSATAAAAYHKVNSQSGYNSGLEAQVAGNHRFRLVWVAASARLDMVTYDASAVAEYAWRYTYGGALQGYYAGSVKFASDTYGVTVTGALTDSMHARNVGGSTNPDSFTINDGVSTFIHTGTTTRASATITMPANPKDNQPLSLMFAGAITALTLSPNTGQSINGAITTVAANGFARYRYRSADTTWYQEFTTASTAAGGTKTYAILTPMTSMPPASNYATLDTRNSIAVLDFDASTDESATWVSIMPEGASLASGLKVRIHWMATTATTGTCRWGVQIERMNTDLDSDSFDTAATAGSTTNGTSGIITVTEITITTIDSVAAGEPFRIKVYRDADGTSGTDDMAGDAELVCVEVRSAA